MAVACLAIILGKLMILAVREHRRSGGKHEPRRGIRWARVGRHLDGLLAEAELERSDVGALASRQRRIA